MRRETTRRKLEDLANRGFLKKIKGGYTLPAQTDAADYTKELRDFLVSKVRGLQNYIEKYQRNFSINRLPPIEHNAQIGQSGLL
jgi:DeoR/GlpR family transcriptional regulator of sugar metabolism